MNRLDPVERIFYAFLLFALVVLAVLVLHGCAATRNAGIRRMAESHAQARGLADARAYCLDAGLERTCGEGRP